MSGRITESDLFNAVAVLYGEWLSINSTETREIDSSVILPTKIPDPETIYLKKEAFENLSDEAKEIIDTILNGPEEVLQYFASPIEKKINKRRILEYYKEKWFSPLFAKEAVKEISKWAKHLK
jgi:hypothetical protein